MNGAGPKGEWFRWHRNRRQPPTKPVERVLEPRGYHGVMAQCRWNGKREPKVQNSGLSRASGEGAGRDQRATLGLAKLIAA